MQGCRIEYLSVLWVAGEEAAGLGIVVSGAEVVEAEVGVVLFTSVEVVVWRGAG